jgi:hypothetical protein
MENPEHKESAEQYRSQYEFFSKKLKEHNPEGDIATFEEMQKCDTFIIFKFIKEYAQLAVKEAREQDIKEMKKSKVHGNSPQSVAFDHGINKSISILESKLEGGEKI